MTLQKIHSECVNWCRHPPIPPGMMLSAWTPEELSKLSLFFLDHSYFHKFVFRHPGGGKRYCRKGSEVNARV